MSVSKPLAGSQMVEIFIKEIASVFNCCNNAKSNSTFNSDKKVNYSRRSSNQLGASDALQQGLIRPQSQNQRREKWRERERERERERGGRPTASCQLRCGHSSLKSICPRCDKFLPSRNPSFFPLFSRTPS